MRQKNIAKRIQRAIIPLTLTLALSAGTLSGCTKKEAEPTPSPKITMVAETPSLTATPAFTPEPTVTPEPTAEPVTFNPVSFNNPDFPFTPTSYEAKIPDYTVAPDLSNVVNLAQFGEFTEKQKQMLAENHFVVIPSTEQQLFFVLEQNEYKSLPSFVTTDAVLHMYHIFFDYTLRHAEEQSLLPATERLTVSMLLRLDEMLSSPVNYPAGQRTKSALEYCAAYFHVANALIGGTDNIARSENIQALFAAEMESIDGKNGLGQSQIAETVVNYDEFTVRGHYTRSDNLSRYFTAMMWYGTLPFNVFDDSGRILEDSILKGMLMTYALMSLAPEDGWLLWESVYAPTSFFVGDSDDLTPYEYWSLMLEVYGDNFNISELDNSEKLAEFAQKAYEMRQPKIANKIAAINSGLQFRFMGQRYIPDAEITQRLSEPIVRPVPSGLDVAAVLGSAAAEKYVSEYLKPSETWPDYPVEFDKLKTEFDNLPEETWRSNMYYGWLWTLKPLFSEYGEGYPAFMQTSAWTDKALTTMLASWAELAHDTVLYGKRGGAEGGGWLEIINPGYVEPSVEVYERLLWLTEYSRATLSQRNILSPTVGDKMDDFSNLLNFLITCSIKELNFESLTDEEYNRIITIGGWLERLSATTATDGETNRWWEIESETDRNMALISDVHSVLDRLTGKMLYLEEAVGTAAEIYVITPHPNGNLYLTRGAVFDYYEFLSEEKLTDEKWQEMLKNEKAPERWGWTESYFDGSETDRFIPYPEHDY